MLAPRTPSMFLAVQALVEDRVHPAVEQEEPVELEELTGLEAVVEEAPRMETPLVPEAMALTGFALSRPTCDQKYVVPNGTSNIPWSYG